MAVVLFVPPRSLCHRGLRREAAGPRTGTSSPSRDDGSELRAFAQWITAMGSTSSVDAREEDWCRRGDSKRAMPSRVVSYYVVRCSTNLRSDARRLGTDCTVSCRGVR